MVLGNDSATTASGVPAGRSRRRGATARPADRMRPSRSTRCHEAIRRPRSIPVRSCSASGSCSATSRRRPRRSQASSFPAAHRQNPQSWSYNTTHRSIARSRLSPAGIIAAEHASPFRLDKRTLQRYVGQRTTHDWGSAVVANASRTSLAREAIGLREVIFQSITHMAPAAAVAFSIPFGIAFGGGATPLAVIFALVGSLFVALSIGQLAKHLPSAGSFYTYASKSLHPSVGFLVGWGYAFVEPLVAPLLFLNLGFAAADVFHTEFNWAADLWWPWAIAGAIVVFVIGYLGIRVSAGAGTILGIFEIAVFTLIAITDHNTLAVFTTKYANNPDFKGFSGVVAASVFTVLAFIGFEAAAPLAEEAKDPRRTVRRAVVGSAVVIGLYYVLTTYAVTAFVGPGKAKDFATGAGWLGLGRSAWGAFGFLMIFLAIVNPN